MPEPHILLSVTAPRFGQPTLESRLARGRLALARHQAVAEQHFGHQIGRDARAFDGRLDGRATQVVCSQRGKVALKTAHGGASGGNDDDGV